ncbi:MAG: hypothetical protein KAH18_12225 [Psychromonas sp.]|nr:hypothetical protein [Psychromonas sp.]
MIKNLRQPWIFEHLLFYLLFLRVTATIAGAESWNEINDFTYK